MVESRETCISSQFTVPHIQVAEFGVQSSANRVVDDILSAKVGVEKVQTSEPGWEFCENVIDPTRLASTRK